MYLRALQITNVKLMRDVRIDFTRDGAPRMWTVLLGANGMCKTTLLHAIGLAASGGVRAKSLANTASLRDLRRPDEPVDIYAEFGFSSALHAHREYPRIVGSPRPETPPVLYSKLTLAPGRSDFEEKSGYFGFASSGSPLAEARSQQLPLWFAAGYGVNRSLPLPLSAEEPDDLATMRMGPLFDKNAIIGTGFSDLFPDDMARAFVKVLRTVLLEGARLLPKISQLDLRGKHGVRRARDLVESHRFDFDAGPETVRRRRDREARETRRDEQLKRVWDQRLGWLTAPRQSFVALSCDVLDHEFPRALRRQWGLAEPRPRHVSTTRSMDRRT